MAECRVRNAECVAENEMADRKIPGSRLLSNAFFRKREAQAFPSAPSKDRVVRAPRPHTVFLAALAWGCPMAKAVGNSIQL